MVEGGEYPVSVTRIASGHDQPCWVLRRRCPTRILLAVEVAMAVDAGKDTTGLQCAYRGVHEAPAEFSAKLNPGQTLKTAAKSPAVD